MTTLHLKIIIFFLHNLFSSSGSCRLKCLISNANPTNTAQLNAAPFSFGEQQGNNYLKWLQTPFWPQADSTLLAGEQHAHDGSGEPCVRLPVPAGTARQPAEGGGGECREELLLCLLS